MGDYCISLTSFFSTAFLAHWSTLGATRTKDARELLYARQKVVVTTKAFGLQAIDLVYIDYKDVEGLRQQAREGALMGFTGTLPLHLTLARRNIFQRILFENVCCIFFIRN